MLKDNNDKLSIRFSDKDKANILQNQFASVFIHEPPGDVPSLPTYTEFSTNHVKVTTEMVHEELSNLNINKSVGPDEIHPRILNELADELSEPIALLLNKSLEVGQIPQDWKKAYVSPIYKKGARNRAENYRPISLTSIVCKIMERFVKTAILNHMIDNNLLSRKQYGFISGRSTVIQLLRYLDECMDSANSIMKSDSKELAYQR